MLYYSLVQSAINSNIFKDRTLVFLLISHYPQNLINELFLNSLGRFHFNLSYNLVHFKMIQTKTIRFVQVHLEIFQISFKALLSTFL